MAEPIGQGSIYVETSVFIYATEGAAQTATPAKRLLDTLRRRPGLAITSEVTLAETLAPPTRADALPLGIKRRAYLDLLIWSGFINLVPVSRDILIETADLRSARRLKLLDAIHLVTAIRSNCRFLVSGDQDFRIMPPGLSYIPSDDSSIDALLKEIA
jgi:predicted nucleic acid-binding protein